MSARPGESDSTMADTMFERLKAEGWHLCPEKVLTEIEEFHNLVPKVALEELKNSDLKHIGVAAFPDEASKVRSDLLWCC